MKILWICNKQPALVSKILKNNAGYFGGWLDKNCQLIIADKKNELLVMFPAAGEISGAYGNLKYASFSERNRIESFCGIIKSFLPDVIHIWGTEMRHCLDAVTACEKTDMKERCVISIQGLVSVYGKYHFTEGLPQHVIKRFTLRDFIKRNNIELARKEFIKRGKWEIEAIKKVSHIIGRTDFDRANISQINPGAQYYFCDETLRDEFYTKQWDISTMRRHSIFVSQCSYPVKGFHFLLEAMPAVIRRYPDVHIYTTGPDLTHLSFKNRVKISSYALYLHDLIKKYDLGKYITFSGYLSAEKMAEMYMSANVFVSPSTIENSPNSVGEAMLVGCPVVSSDVGGVKNFINHGMEGFVYHSTAPYMLAYYICALFDNDNLAESFSENARIRAKKIFDVQTNFETLVSIYNKISGEGK